MDNSQSDTSSKQQPEKDDLRLTELPVIINVHLFLQLGIGHRLNDIGTIAVFVSGVRTPKDSDDLQPNFISQYGEGLVRRKPI